MNKHLVLFSRLSLFLVYFWFGALKVLTLSPAEKLVHELFDKTLWFLMPFEYFFLLFSVFECVLGVMFLFKIFDKISFPILLAHLFTTSLPLIFLPSYTWSGFLVLTLAGQYIFKNLLLIVAGWVIYSQRKRAVA